MSEKEQILQPLNKNFKEPKLRFPEFHDSFIFGTLGDFFNIYNGISKDKDSFGFGNPIINYMDVNQNVRIVGSIVTGLVNTNAKDILLYQVTTRDVLFTRTSETIDEIGLSSYLSENIENCVFSGFLLKASPKSNLPLPSYIALQFRSTPYRKKIQRVATITSRALINSDNLSKIEVFIPSKKEQAKTTEFLLLLYKKIELLESKISILKKYKKGFVNKMIFGDIKVPLENFLSETSERTTINNQYDIISSTVEGCFLQKEYFNHQVASQNNSGYKIVKRNQIIFSPQNLWLGNINLNEEFEIGIVSPSYKVFNILKINPKYLIELLKTNKMKYLYKICSEQGASVVRRNLNMEQLLKSKISIHNKNMQNKIANLLFCYDKILRNYKIKLKQLHLLKLQLLKNLFI